MSFKLTSFFIILCPLMGSLTGDSNDREDPGLIQDVDPNFDVVKGLICYQCHSLSSELQPLCDKSMFRLVTKSERHNMSLQCPDYQGSYCFIKIITKGKLVETIRGCTGPKDKNGYLMKVGCMTKKDEVVCLCDYKFCNKATSYGFLRNYYVYFLFFVIALI